MLPTVATLPRPASPDPALGRPADASARLVVYPDGPGAPAVIAFEHSDPLALVDDLVAAALPATSVPADALREIVENLIHARFAGAVVSVLDAGATVRVSDRGPGIADPGRALRPGFTAADPDAALYLRAVGAGLPLALCALTAAAGRLEIESNLAGGTVVTLAVPEPAPGATATGRDDRERALLALLVELGDAHPHRLSAELSLPAGLCARHLLELERAGLVAADHTGARRLTRPGAERVAEMFAAVPSPES